MAESVKPGWKTTEFWLTVAAMIVTMLLASGVWTVDSTWGKILSGLAAVLASAGYSIARAGTKKAASAAPTEPKPPA